MVSFDLDAHEYKGRWFNSVRAWNVQRVDPNAVAGAMGGMQPGASPFPPMGAAPVQPAPAAAPAGGATAPFPPAQPAAPAAEGGSARRSPILSYEEELAKYKHLPKDFTTPFFIFSFIPFDSFLLSSIFERIA